MYSAQYPVCSTIVGLLTFQHLRTNACIHLLLVMSPAVHKKFLFRFAGKQDSAKPPKSSLTLGDARINPFITSYRTEYAAPFASGARIRSPLRNKMLADVADLKEIYSSAFQRVGEYVQSCSLWTSHLSFSSMVS